MIDPSESVGHIETCCQAFIWFRGTPVVGVLGTRAVSPPLRHISTTACEWLPGSSRLFCPLLPESECPGARISLDLSSLLPTHCEGLLFLIEPLGLGARMLDTPTASQLCAFLIAIRTTTTPRPDSQSCPLQVLEPPLGAPWRFHSLRSPSHLPCHSLTRVLFTCFPSLLSSTLLQLCCLFVFDSPPPESSPVHYT